MIPDVLALAAERLGGDHAPAVRARLAAMRGHVPKNLSKSDRAMLLAKARAPVPEGLRLVHATWIEAALADLPPRARAAVASPSADPIDIWLARWATAAFPPMVVIDTRAIPIGPDALPWLVSIGADQLALALGPAAARAIGRVGDPLRISIPRIVRAPRLGQLGPQRAALARARDLSLDDDLALVTLGCRAVAPHLAAMPLAILQLTRSLPRRIGIVAERELHACANTPLADAPAWAALVAR